MVTSPPFPGILTNSKKPYQIRTVFVSRVSSIQKRKRFPFFVLWMMSTPPYLFVRIYRNGLARNKTFCFYFWHPAFDGDFSLNMVAARLVLFVLFAIGHGSTFVHVQCALFVLVSPKWPPWWRLPYGTRLLSMLCVWHWPGCLVLTHLLYLWRLPMCVIFLCENFLRQSLVMCCWVPYFRYNLCVYPPLCRALTLFVNRAALPKFLSSLSPEPGPSSKMGKNKGQPFYIKTSLAVNMIYNPERI